MAEVEDNDRGLAAIFDAASELDGVGVKVGLLAGAGQHEGSKLSVAEVGAANEFGTDHVPERSFIRAGIDEAQGKIDATTAALIGKVFGGEISPVVAAQRLGLFGVGVVQAKITDGPFVPNAPSTVEAKGSSAPLIDTGSMRQHVTFEVTDVASARDGSITREKK